MDKDHLALLKYIRTYFRIALFTLVFFCSSFGIVFIKTSLKRNTVPGEVDMGMVYLIMSPVVLAVLLFLICANYLYWSKNKISQIDILLTTILAIPVTIYGFLLLVATLFMLIKLAIHP